MKISNKHDSLLFFDAYGFYPFVGLYLRTIDSNNYLKYICVVSRIDKHGIWIKYANKEILACIVNLSVS